jgi:hypothetical protein
MTINGEHTVTFNTGDNNAVTNNNGTYTIKNVVTADDPAGQLKVAITAKGYSSKEATFNKERPMPKFTTSLDKTSLGADANQVVTLTFSSEDLVDGMPVTLELDGLKPQGDLPTKAVTSYVYTVNGTGTQTIALVTTEKTTSSKTCSIQLKAEGFEDSETMTVLQQDAISATIPELIVKFVWDHSKDPEDNYVRDNIKLSISDGTITKPQNNNITTNHSNDNDRVYTTTMKNVKVENATPDAIVTISYTGKSNSNTYTYSANVNIQDLIANPNITIEEQ